MILISPNLLLLSLQILHYQVNDNMIIVQKVLYTRCSLRADWSILNAMRSCLGLAGAVFNSGGGVLADQKVRYLIFRFCSVLDVSVEPNKLCSEATFACL